MSVRCPFLETYCVNYNGSCRRKDVVNRRMELGRSAVCDPSSYSQAVQCSVT